MNPGPVDTGWMNDEIRATLAGASRPAVLGTPADVARLISFLLSDDGAWTTGQLIHTDGGFSSTGPMLVDGDEDLALAWPSSTHRSASTTSPAGTSGRSPA